MHRSSRTLKRLNNGKLWSKFDRQKLIELYPQMQNFQLARMFSRTQGAIMAQARRLGLQKNYEQGFKPLREQGNRWSDEDIRILRKMYYTHTFEEIGDAIGRTASAVHARAIALKLKKLKFWTKEEDNYLRRFFTPKPVAELARVLGRTCNAIKSRAAHLGLEHKLKRWTDAQLDLLARHYPTMQTEQVAKLIGRHITRIIAQAVRLGIKKDSSIASRAGRRLWTQDEVYQVLHLYKHHTKREIADILGYPYASLKLLLKRRSVGKCPHWNRKEDDTIRKLYNKLPFRKLAEKLGRTRKSTEARAKALCLVKQAHWNFTEVRILRREFRKGTPVREIVNIVGRSRKSCDHKIARLGLR